jgi:hypothetical protein
MAIASAWSSSVQETEIGWPIFQTLRRLALGETETTPPRSIFVFNVAAVRDGTV